MNAPCPPRWTVPALDDPSPSLPADPSLGDGPGSRPLTQAWRTAPEPGFRPAWARLRWRPDALLCEAYFPATAPANRARRLNERTWETGDVGEIFLQAEDRPDYLEIHVTPANVRLQLRWPPGGLQAMRSGTRPFEEFTVAAPDWVASRAESGPAAWAMQVRIPPALLERERFEAGLAFRIAVCRYQHEGDRPIVSSTAPFSVAAFHRPHEWHRAVLAPALTEPA